MNRQPPPPRQPRPLDNENGDNRALQESGYIRPTFLPQARNAGPQRGARPTILDPQPSQRQARPDPNLQRQQQLYQEQPPRPLQRIPSRPQQPPLQRRPSRPDEYPYQDPRQQLQRTPSRPDQSQPLPPSPRPLQRQRSRPDEQQQPLPLQRQPSRPDQPPMADYQYNQLPVQPVMPAFMYPAAAPAPHALPALQTGAPPLPTSDSQTTLSSPGGASRMHSDKMLIRGNGDDELDKTDAFWRRFNASAQQDAEKSSWLEKTQGKTSRHYRTLWIVGIIFVLLAAGGIGIGIFLSFRSNSSTERPDSIGGAADITSGAGAVAATIGGGGGGGTVGAGTVATTTSSLHVSPTNTVP